MSNSVNTVFSSVPEAFYDAIAYYISGTLFWLVPFWVSGSSETLRAFLSSHTIWWDGMHEGKTYVLVFLATAGAYVTGVCLTTMGTGFKNLVKRWHNREKPSSKNDSTSKHEAERLKAETAEGYWGLTLIKDEVFNKLHNFNSEDGKRYLRQTLKKREGIVKLSRSLFLIGLWALFLSFWADPEVKMSWLLLNLSLLVPLYINLYKRQKWLDDRVRLAKDKLNSPDYSLFDL